MGQPNPWTTLVYEKCVIGYVVMYFEGDYNNILNSKYRHILGKVELLHAKRD